MPLFRLFNWLTYNFWYLKRPPWDTNQSPPELLEFIKTHPVGKAVDMGCGTGKNCLTLAEAGWQTVGVDLAILAVQKARNRFKSAGLEGRFHFGDILDDRFSPGEFDLVLDIGCYHNLPVDLRGHYRANVVRWLKTGGCFLIYGHRLSLRDESVVRISESDVVDFQQNLDLLKRENCHDRWGRETIWLSFTKTAR